MNAKWLGVLILLVSAPIFGATSDLHHSNLQVCDATRDLIPQLWRAGAYEVPPAVPPLMLAAIDGEASRAVDAINAMDDEDAHRWRQLALYTAAAAGQSGTVDVLLNHGADVDGSALMPPFHAGLYRDAIADLAHRAPFTPKAISALEAMGVVSNEPQSTGPAIYPAIMCNDVETVAVLLRHRADPMRQPWPTRPSSQRGADPFLTAVASGDAEITQAFLQRGADPCIEDRRLADSRKGTKDRRRSPSTIASIGSKAGLPPALIQRLACHSSPPTS